MEIKLYNCEDDSHHIPKHFNLIATKVGSLREESSIENPVIRMINPMQDFNYIHIPDYNRYYYVLDIVEVRTGIIDIVCHCDVLQSFYKQFIYAPMCCTRSDSTYNKFIADARRKYEQRQEHEYVHIGSFGKESSIVLVGIG